MSSTSKYGRDPVRRNEFQKPTDVRFKKGEREIMFKDLECWKCGTRMSSASRRCKRCKEINMDYNDNWVTPVLRKE